MVMKDTVWQAIRLGNLDSESPVSGPFRTRERAVPGQAKTTRIPPWNSSFRSSAPCWC